MSKQRQQQRQQQQQQQQQEAPPDPKAAPFVRTDYYGDAGLRPLSLLDRVRLSVLAVTLLPLRVVATVACISSFFVIVRLATLLPSELLARRIIAFWGKVWCRLCLLALGFVSVRWVRLGGGGSSDAEAARAVGIVSSHLSWIDILVHMSHSFPSFAAREGTQKLPMIGIISQKMQCVYVQRAKVEGAANGGGVGTQIRDRMLHSAAHPEEEIRPMLLFPEGTTTNGHYLLPFKTGAFLAGVPVQPVVIQYGQTGRMSPCWEAISAPRHIFLLMAEPLHSVTCYELPVYVPSEEERRDAKLYAANVRQYMLKYCKHLRPTDATLEDKWAYLQALRARLGIK